MNGPTDCAKCGAIFPAGALQSDAAGKLTCPICRTELRPLVHGDTGQPWTRKDSALWFLAMFGGHELACAVVVLIVLGLGLFTVVK